MHMCSVAEIDPAAEGRVIGVRVMRTTDRGTAEIPVPHNHQPLQRVPVKGWHLRQANREQPEVGVVPTGGPVLVADPEPLYCLQDLLLVRRVRSTTSHIVHFGHRYPPSGSLDG